VRLSQLFERGNTLVAYSFMYGTAPRLAQVTNLVVIAKSPMSRISEAAVLVPDA